jgi:small subunit ribosomal protein S6
MKEYELLYIVPAQYTDEEISGIQGTIATLVEGFGAKVLRNENLGKIRMAYQIKGVRHGSYILVHFNAEADQISELNRKLGLTDEVLRHTIVDRRAGALEKTFEISSYVAPLSEEARQQTEDARSAKPMSKPVVKTPVKVAPPVPVKATDTKMSMEELDEKLDKILEGDIEKKA